MTIIRANRGGRPVEITVSTYEELRAVERALRVRKTNYVVRSSESVYGSIVVPPTERKQVTEFFNRRRGEKPLPALLRDVSGEREIERASHIDCIDLEPIA